MGKRKMKLASLLLAAALLFGLMPAIAEPAFAADDHNWWWQSVDKLMDMWNYDENGMAIVETIDGTGEYYLTGDLTMDRPLLVKSGTTVTICLHGHSIIVPSDEDAEYVFCIEEGATLNIENCTTGGYISNASSACYAAIYNEGELNISGGNIGSNKSAIISDNGKVSISGGVIGAGTAAINMSGGILNVSGSAEITGPDAGIIMQVGTLNISGGTVKSTKLGSTGIMMPGFATANISDGEIRGVKYGLQALQDSTVNFSGGEISCETGITDSVAVFSGDSSLNISASDLSMPITYGPIDAVYSNVDIRGGYFSDSPGAYINEAYKIVPSGYTSYPFAVVEKDKFTVTFTDGAGHVISTQQVYENGNAAAPADPSRTGYIFTGWDKEFTNITADTTVNATWKEEPPEEKIDNGKKAPPSEIIDLPAVKISKPKAAKKKITVKWKKISKKNQKKIKGVQIQVATDPGFKNIVKSAKGSKKKTSKVVKGLKSKTKYYVRIRAYAAGKHYSVWKSKSVKVK